jgi:hypothetical protein
MELQQFDKRIYRAMQTMVDTMSAELKRLGVPFYGVRPELIISPEEREAGGTPPPPANGVGPKITEGELLKLQRRMIEYLEDLYRP